MSFEKSIKLLLATLLLGGVVACGGGSSDDGPDSVDTDGDGVVDSVDAFPNDPSESADTDSDGIGDNADICPAVADADQLDSDADGIGNACEATYSFENQAGESTVSYSGQTARHVLIDDLVTSMLALRRFDPDGGGRTAQQLINEELSLYYLNENVEQSAVNVLDSVDIGFSLKDGGDLDGDGNADVVLATDPSDPSVTTLGSISTEKTLDDKIAGNDKCAHILVDGDNFTDCEGGGVRGEFFGWELGLNADPLVRKPDDLVQFFFSLIAAEATKDTATLIATAENPSTVVPSPTVNNLGHDFRQLVQKFLLGAVTFSQATTDYLQIDFASPTALAPEGTESYTAGQHDWD